MNFQLTNYQLETLFATMPTLDESDPIWRCSIGEKKKLTLTYTIHPFMGKDVLTFNPYLFNSVEKNTPQWIPDTIWRLDFDRSTPLNTFIDGNYIGLENLKNDYLRYKISTDRKTLTIEYNFFVTADLDVKLSQFPLLNVNRYLKRNFADTELLKKPSENFDYVITHIGAHLTLAGILSDFEILIGASSVQVKRNDGGSWVDDGYVISNSGEWIVYDGSELITKDADLSAVTATILTFSNATILTEQISSYSKAPKIVIYGDSYRIIQSNIGFDYATQLENIPTELYFYRNKEGFVPDFTLIRNSEEVTDFSATQETLVRCRMLIEGELTSVQPSEMRLTLIRVNNTTDQKPFFEDYDGVSFDGSTVQFDGNKQKSDVTIPASKFDEDGIYRVLAVWYDNNNNEEVYSFISDEYTVSSIPDTLAIPELTGKITNHTNVFTDKHVEHACPYDRYKLTLDIDKSSYEALLTTQGGDYDSNILSVVMNYDGKRIQANWVNGEWISNNESVLEVTDSGTKTTADFFIRMLPGYKGLEKTHKWEVNFKTEPSTITFKQLIRVDDFDTTVLTLLELKDPSGGYIIDYSKFQNKYIEAYSEADFGQLATDGLELIAVIDNEGEILEYAKLDGKLEKLQNSKFKDVSTYFEPSNGASFDFLNADLKEGAYVVVIGHRHTGGDPPQELEGVDYWTIGDDFVVQ